MCLEMNLTSVSVKSYIDKKSKEENCLNYLPVNGFLKCFIQNGKKLIKLR